MYRCVFIVDPSPMKRQRGRKGGEKWCSKRKLKKNGRKNEKKKKGREPTATTTTEKEKGEECERTNGVGHGMVMKSESSRTSTESAMVRWRPRFSTMRLPSTRSSLEKGR